LGENKKREREEGRREKRTEKEKKRANVTFHL
jgi:hypothetical protein